MILGTWIGWIVTFFVVMFVGFGVLGLLYRFRPWDSPADSDRQEPPHHAPVNASLKGSEQI